MPNNIMQIGETKSNRAFSVCLIKLDSFSYKGCVKIERNFYRCFNLKEDFKQDLNVPIEIILKIQ